MKKVIRNPWLVFCLCFLAINIPLWLFAINLFPGEIVLENELSTQAAEANLSLSYFIGLGYSDEDMIGVKSFYLTGKGIALALCICVGMPAIVALRQWSTQKRS